MNATLSDAAPLGIRPASEQPHADEAEMSQAWAHLSTQ